jgi:hypothetical protein
MDKTFQGLRKEVLAILNKTDYPIVLLAADTTKYYKQGSRRLFA